MGKHTPRSCQAANSREHSLLERTCSALIRLVGRHAENQVLLFAVRRPFWFPFPFSEIIWLARSSNVAIVHSSMMVSLSLCVSSLSEYSSFDLHLSPFIVRITPSKPSCP